MKMLLLAPLALLMSVARAQDSSAHADVATTENKIPSSTNDSLSTAAIRTDSLPDGKHNMYGDLLNDDPRYNPRYPWWRPAIRVVFADVFTWAIDRYVMDADYSHIGPHTWKNNIREGWEWDADRFGINFIG